jgi:DNA/RNA-binding protein KIN17
MSESHQRQLLLFADNSSKFMDDFSREFNTEYLNTLRRRFGTKRVNANIVYQELIADRNHIHMNATKWLTLTDYVQYLGRQGHCIIDQTEKGWFVTYIDRDPEALRRQEEIEKKRKLEIDDQQRQQIYLEKQMEKDKQKGPVQTVEPTELKKNENEVLKINFLKPKSNLKETHIINEDKPCTSNNSSDEDESCLGSEVKQAIKQEPEQTSEQINCNLSDQNIKIKSESSRESTKNLVSDNFDSKPLQCEEIKKEKTSSFNSMSISSSSSASSSSKASISSSNLSGVFKLPEKRKNSALDDIIADEEKRKEKLNRKDYWLHKNIIVKIITNKLGEKYYKKKAIVMDVIDLYTAVVKLTETGTVIKLDQAHLETVLPAVGRKVLVVNGAYRGEIATLEDINEKEFSVKIIIAAGPLKGRVVNGVQYEDISKLNE